MFVARDTKPSLLLYVLTNTIRPGQRSANTISHYSARRALAPLGSRMTVSALGASHHDGCEKQESSEEEETAQTVQGISLSKQLDAIPFLEAAPSTFFLKKTQVKNYYAARVAIRTHAVSLSLYRPC